MPEFKIGDIVVIKSIPEIIHRSWYHTEPMKIIKRFDRRNGQPSDVYEVLFMDGKIDNFHVFYLTTDPYATRRYKINTALL